MGKFDYPSGFVFVGLVVVCFGAGFFVGSSTIGAAISGFLLSIFSSSVFFFLTVTLKDYSEKKKIKNIVNPMLESIVTTLYSAIHNSVLDPNSSCRPRPNPSKLSIGELDKLLDFDDLNSPIEGFRLHYSQFDIKAKTNIEQLVLDTTLPIESMLEQIKPYYFMLEYDVVKILTEIEGSAYISFVGRSLKFDNSFKFDKFLFLDFCRLVKKIEGYVDVKH